MHLTLSYDRLQMKSEQCRLPLGANPQLQSKILRKWTQMSRISSNSKGELNFPHTHIVCHLQQAKKSCTTIYALHARFLVVFLNAQHINDMIFTYYLEGGKERGGRVEGHDKRMWEVWQWSGGKSWRGTSRQTCQGLKLLPVHLKDKIQWVILWPNSIIPWPNFSVSWIKSAVGRSYVHFFFNTKYFAKWK